MNAVIAAARVQTLAEWASEYERNPQREGDREAAFLLRRAARQIAGSYGVQPGIPIEDPPRNVAPPVDEPRMDEKEPSQ